LIADIQIDVSLASHLNVAQKFDAAILIQWQRSLRPSGVSVLTKFSAKNRVPAVCWNAIGKFEFCGGQQEINARRLTHILSSLIRRVTSESILEAVLLLMVEIVGTAAGRGLGCILDE